MPEYFLVRCDKNPSKAGPENWTNFEGYKKSTAAIHGGGEQFMSQLWQGILVPPLSLQSHSNHL